MCHLPGFQSPGIKRGNGNLDTAKYNYRENLNRLIKWKKETLQYADQAF